MKFLTVNTAGITTEIAYFDGEEARFYKDENGKKASEVLLEKIDALLGETALSELDYLACVTGPGSFTGIRIGVNTVKAFCFALNKPALGISYNKAISTLASRKCFSVITGWADNCYVAVYDESGNEMLVPTATTIEDAVKMKTESYADYALVVDTDAYECLNNLGAIIVNSPDYLFKATEQAITKGEFFTAETLAPYYAMKSQAERDLEK